MTMQDSSIGELVHDRRPQSIAARFCILVNSSDYARDVFEIVYRHGERMWRDCNWPRFVGFTSQHPDIYGFKAVSGRGAKGWREQLIAQLDSLPEQIEYVIRLDEDLLFLSPVDGEKLNAIAREVLRADLVYVSLVPVSRGLLGRVVEFVRRKLSSEPLRLLSFSEPYYSSLNPAIWKRSHLKSLLRRPGNVWEFEHIVPDAKHYAVWAPVLDYDALVSKGKWFPRARRQLERQGLSLANSSRPFQTVGARLRAIRQRVTFAALGYSSFRLRKKLNLLPRLPKELARDELEPVQKGQSQ